MPYDPEKYQQNKQKAYENLKRWKAKQGDEFRIKTNQLVLKAVHKYYENNRDKVLEYKKHYYQTVTKPRKEAAKREREQTLTVENQELSLQPRLE